MSIDATVVEDQVIGHLLRRLDALVQDYDDGLWVIDYAKAEAIQYASKDDKEVHSLLGLFLESLRHYRNFRYTSTSDLESSLLTKKFQSVFSFERWYDEAHVRGLVIQQPNAINKKLRILRDERTSLKSQNADLKRKTVELQGLLDECLKRKPEYSEVEKGGKT